MQQVMQERHLALIFATKMDEGMQIDPVPTTPPIPTFLSTTLQTQNLHSRPRAQHRSQNDNDGHGVGNGPSSVLLISGNLVAPLKMGNWGIHHSRKRKGRNIPLSSLST